MTKGYEQRKAANERYLAKQDELKIRLTQGQKATVQAAATQVGESVNQYTQRALLARMGLADWPKIEQEETEE